MVTSERKLEQLKESDKMKRTAARMNAENGRHRKRTESETCFCLLLCLFFLRLRRTTIELNLFFFTEDSLDYISFCCVFSKHLFRFKLANPSESKSSKQKWLPTLSACPIKTAPTWRIQIRRHNLLYKTKKNTDQTK